MAQTPRKIPAHEAAPGLSPAATPSATGMMAPVTAASGDATATTVVARAE
ncbi:MAG: hypothetical protein ABSG38_11460 [Spirochaetia bacterium]